MQSSHLHYKGSDVGTCKVSLPKTVSFCSCLAVLKMLVMMSFKRPSTSRVHERRWLFGSFQEQIQQPHSIGCWQVRKGYHFFVYTLLIGTYGMLLLRDNFHTLSDQTFSSIAIDFILELHMEERCHSYQRKSIQNLRSM